MSQEPLDYQTPRSRDNGAVACSRCGGTRVVQGNLTWGTGVRFAPRQVKSFWTLSGGAKTLTYACLSCGAITILIDPDDLRRLLGTGDPGGSAAT